MAEDEKSGNNATELMTYFSTEEKPCKVAEFMEFWKSLSPEEKAYFKSAELS